MFQIIISPAKQMLDPTLCDTSFEPCGRIYFPEETQLLVKSLSSLSISELKEIWGCSDALTQKNASLLARYKDTYAALAETSNQAICAMEAYQGLQYQHLAAWLMSQDEIDWLQHHLWILSGLFGALRPLTPTLPYRLEMQAAYNPYADPGTKAKLTHFWSNKLSKLIEASAHTPSGEAPPTPNTRAASEACIVNLASVEYGAVVAKHLSPHCRLITPIFAEAIKNNKPVQRSSASKAARGTMVRWMAQLKLEDPECIKDFDLGYSYSEALSDQAHIAGLSTKARHDIWVFLADGAKLDDTLT